MTRTTTAALLAAASLPLAAACAPRPTGHHEVPATSAAGAPRAPSPGLVDGATAAALAKGGAKVVDVRTPEEYAEGHVPAAVNIPFDQIGQRASEIGGPATPVVVYCRSGRRSGIAAESLRGLGYTKVWDAQRYEAWPAPDAQYTRATSAPE
jgi:phage shock protein E